VRCLWMSSHCFCWRNCPYFDTVCFNDDETIITAYVWKYHNFWNSLNVIDWRLYEYLMLLKNFDMGSLMICETLMNFFYCFCWGNCPYHNGINKKNINISKILWKSFIVSCISIKSIYSNDLLPNFEMWS